MGKLLRLGFLLISLAYIFALHSVFNHQQEPDWLISSELTSFRGEHPHERRREALQFVGMGDNGDILGDEIVVNDTNVAIIRRRVKSKASGEEEEKVERPRLAQSPHLSKFRITKWGAKPRIAICLVGAARDFDLTGPKIVEHLLNAYPEGDVFLHSPLDENAHRLSLLQAAAPNVVNVRIAPDVPINESDVTDFVLRWVRGGPEYVTRQQLMQQFKSIEMCVPMITEFERRHKFRYKWVMRTRVDSYWMGPPPALAELNSTGFTIPEGSDWGGLNDRLGVAYRRVSWLGLKRLSVLKELAEAGYSDLNAEKAFRAQLEHLKVKVSRANFPFCILSRKKGSQGFPVAAALSSKASLNGAKCRPCAPTVVGEESTNYILKLPEKRVFGPESSGVDLCEADDGWEDGWEAIYDNDAGPEFAAVRKYINQRNLTECERDWREFQSSVLRWDVPPPRVLCMRSFLGHVHKLGFPGGDWPFFGDILSPSSVVYVVASNSFSWDYQMIRHHKVDLHVFESTPEGLRWKDDHFENLPPQYIPHPWLLGTTDTLMTVYPMEMVDKPFSYALQLPENMVQETVPGILVESRTVEATMQLLNHTHVDVLRIGGDKTLHEALFKSWSTAGRSPRVCQIIVSFLKAEKHYGSPAGRKELLLLREIGIELAICIPRGAVPEERIYESCLFFSTHHCPMQSHH